MPGAVRLHHGVEDGEQLVQACRGPCKSAVFGRDPAPVERARPGVGSKAALSVTERKGGPARWRACDLPPASRSVVGGGMARGARSVRRTLVPADGEARASAVVEQRPMSVSGFARPFVISPEQDPGPPPPPTTRRWISRSCRNGSGEGRAEAQRRAISAWAAASGPSSRAAPCRARSRRRCRARGSAGQIGRRGR
jgi:hypothetical protein